MDGQRPERSERGEADTEAGVKISVYKTWDAPYIIAGGYISMKKVSYSGDAAKGLRRHGNMAELLRKAITEYAVDTQAHANNVDHMTGSTGKRMVVGDYRIIFEETGTEIRVTKVGPRGGVYD
jgi:mRNA interferase RelE/StbE